MLTTAMLAAMATFWSPARAAELQSYKVTVLQQTRYDITVDAWKPSPPAILAHAREADVFAVIKVEPLFRLGTQEVAAP
jgi:hypothetical protein